MSDRPTIDREDGTPLAAEYVLGVLDAAERRAFEARLAGEPVLRREVEYWEGRLGALVREVAPVAPPPAVWERVAAAVQRETAPPRAGLWSSLAFWRWISLGSAAVAAASVATLLIVGRVPAPTSPLVAKIDFTAGSASFVAAIDPATGGVTIVPASVSAVTQRVMELWLIAPGDQPRSLGLIEAGRPVHINLPPALLRRVAAEATLAVSLEPPGGSPTGLPTGPVVAAGKLTNL